jgi:flagellin
MGLSIHTNTGATIALQSFNRTNQALAAVQKRVSTGYRVADAKDDGASFAISQKLRGTVKAYEGLNERLAMGMSLFTVSQEAVKRIGDITGDIRKVLVKLADDSLPAEDRATYNTEYQRLKNTITDIGNKTRFNDIGIVREIGAYHPIIGSIDGTVVNGITGLLMANNTIIGLMTPVTNAASAQALLQPGGGMDQYEANVATGTSKLGVYMRSFEKQFNFNEIISQTISDAIGAFVDADLAKDSALLQALQIRQELASQTLNIANQAPNAILSLFQ